MGKTFYSFDVEMPNLPEGSDVMRRELTVAINGATVDVRHVEPNQALVAGLECAHGDTIGLSLVDFDEAGNASPTRAITMIVDRDMVPPGQPGEMNLRFTSERVVEDSEPVVTEPVAEPVVTEPVVTEPVVTEAVVTEAETV